MTILADFGWTALEILARLFHVMVFVGENCIYTAYHMYRATALVIWPILRPTAAMVSHVFIWTDSTVCYGVFTFCCCILVLTTAVVIYRKTLTGVANHGMVAMVQLVNQWLASTRGRLQARGAQFGQHVTVGGTQTVQRDAVEAPRVQGRNQLCSACTGGEAACVVCYTNKKDWMVRTCNHVCLCFECSTENIHHLHGHCPMCRGTISGVERVYF